MSAADIKPDLSQVGCNGLLISTSFELGRRALADCIGITPGQLAGKGAALSARYQSSDNPHEVRGSIRLEEGAKVTGGADKWALDIRCTPYRQDWEPKPVGAKNPFTLLRKLGKSGLRVNANVRAWFSTPVVTGASAQLPIRLKWPGATLTHAIGFTFARLSEVGDLLYEVEVRRQGRDAYQVDVGFTYAGILNERLPSETLARCTQLLELVTTAPEPGSDAPPTNPEPPAASPEIGKQPPPEEAP